MYKTLWSMLFVLGIIASAAQVRAEDEAKKPDAAPPKAEGKAEEPKKEPKEATPKKETVEKRMERRKAAIEKAVDQDDWDKVLAVLDEIIDDKEITEDDVLGPLFDKFQVLYRQKSSTAPRPAPWRRSSATCGRTIPNCKTNWPGRSSTPRASRAATSTSRWPSPLGRTKPPRAKAAPFSTPSPGHTSRRAISTKPSNGRPKPSKN